MAATSLEDTPTWAVSVVCAVLIITSILIEKGFHVLTKCLVRRKRKSLNRALQKIEAELMKMGLISLLLTVAEVPVSRICVSRSVGNSFRPCNDPDSPVPDVASTDQISGLNPTTSSEALDEKSCEAKGMVSLVSRDGIAQLHIFVFVLAVSHVVCCVLTMCLGAWKMKKWKTWEMETTTFDYQISNDPRRFRLTRQTSFGRRHLNCWSKHPALLWAVCFLRQFHRSVTKADYFTLRNGFIAAHFSGGSIFDFEKFLTRTFDEDFEVVVGINFWIWIFSTLFIFFSAHVFYNYFWLPFVPLLMALIAGTKLQVVITKMCLESRNESVVAQGPMLVKPNDNLFWFGWPQFLLHLIHFILFQNSFQLAIFTWAWFEFGFKSCYHRKTEDIILCITMAIIVQLLCGYVTLPLYTLVTQMGSGMKKAVFTERVARGLRHWHSLAHQNLLRNKSSSRGYSEPVPTVSTDTVASNEQLALQGDKNPPSAITNIQPLNSEITEEKENPKAITVVSWDGDISFGTSWKRLDSGREIEDIVSGKEEINTEAIDSIDQIPASLGDEEPMVQE